MILNTCVLKNGRRYWNGSVNLFSNSYMLSTCTCTSNRNSTGNYIPVVQQNQRKSISNRTCTENNRAVLRTQQRRILVEGAFSVHHHSREQQQQQHLSTTTSNDIHGVNTSDDLSSIIRNTSTKQDSIIQEAFLDIRKIQKLYHGICSSNDKSINDNSIANVVVAASRTSSSDDRRDLPLILQTQKDVITYLENKYIITFLFDCDGVLYCSPNSIISGAKECIQSLLLSDTNIGNAKKLYLITNNSLLSRQQLGTKLTSMLQLNDTILSDDMMIMCSYSCARYLKKYFQNTIPVSRRKTIYVIGSQGLCNKMVLYIK
jgi:Haloacid dehalogenase-like hydrolase